MHNILVKVNSIHWKGTEITISPYGHLTSRELDFDPEIFEDLTEDGFEAASPLEFNLYLSGLVKWPPHPRLSGGEELVKLLLQIGVHLRLSGGEEPAWYKIYKDCILEAWFWMVDSSFRIPKSEI